MSTDVSPLWQYLKKAGFWGGLFACVFLLVTALVMLLQTHTHVVRYRLRPSHAQPTEANLERTVRVLKERAHVLRRDLRVGGCRVRAIPPDSIELELRTARNQEELTFALAWLTMPAHVEFRLLKRSNPLRDEEADTEAPADCEIKPYRRRVYDLNRPGDSRIETQHYLVRRQPAFPIESFQKVRMANVGLHKLNVFTFAFRPEDVEPFAELTALNVGRSMVMLVDGEIFLPPRRIEKCIKGGVVQVSDYLFMPPLRKLMKVLNTGPLPAPLEQVSHAVDGRPAP